MSEREYIVTLNKGVDYAQFNQEMISSTGAGEIPNRTVDVADARPKSTRNTHYALTEAEAIKLRNDGFNVQVADATDTDFWNMVHLSKPVEEMILLAMPNHMSNIYAAERIRASKLECKIVAVAKHETEVKELSKLGIPSFNLYREAGEGLANQALIEMEKKG